MAMDCSKQLVIVSLENGFVSEIQKHKDAHEKETSESLQAYTPNT
jgi:hypothetical protein